MVTFYRPELYSIAKSNPFCQLHVAFWNKDVLFLFLCFYLQICNNTIFHTTTQEIDLGCLYNALGNEKNILLLGFHAFTSYDLTGRFSGFLKTTWFNTIKSNSFVHKVFGSLGKNDSGLKEKIINDFTIKYKYFSGIMMVFIF